MPQQSNTNRIQKLSELIQRELANIMLKEMDDPLFKQITVTAVKVSKDLSVAKVYVSCFDQSKVQEVLQLLQANAKAVRYLLAQNLNLRKTPSLYFVHDISVIYGQKLSTLIDQAIAEDEKKHGE
jgi:ribosome-binding factor A